MQLYCSSLTQYQRLPTKEVSVAHLKIGNFHPIRVQTMTTTDTMNTKATVQQAIRCIEAGAELIRITAPSKKEAENLLHIKNELRKQGYQTPLVADIHFTPNAAEIAARIVEKVRINPGNYVDKKKFEYIEYTNAEYAAEIERIRSRFLPLVAICKQYGTAMRIGTNHGSLSDRIMSRYGDTPQGMVESAMEFLRIARDENFHNIVLSMKSSNPQVMVQAYRLLIQQMMQEFHECYPLHLGVTEAGDGEDGRIKSAIGIGTLLEDGIGDTIRVSLTEEPEYEVPVCYNLLKRYPNQTSTQAQPSFIPPLLQIPYNPFEYKRRETFEVQSIGAHHVPVVIADISHVPEINYNILEQIGYSYNSQTDKWNISDMAADFIFTAHTLPHQSLSFPSSLNIICYPATWLQAYNQENVFPIFDVAGFIEAEIKHPKLNFVMVDCFNDNTSINDFTYLDEIANNPSVVLCLSSKNKQSVMAIRRMVAECMSRNIQNPIVFIIDSCWKTADEHLLHFATEAGALLLEGMGDGICLGMNSEAYKNATVQISGRQYYKNTSVEQFLNATSFSILQATRTRISKTEYISCPSCGRTLFDLQQTTEKIRSVTHHLKGVKIAIMGCIVNGPGEMADADFGYVGSGPGKVTLYKGKEVMKRNIDSSIAVEELIQLMKESGVWQEPHYELKV